MNSVCSLHVHEDLLIVSSILPQKKPNWFQKNLRGKTLPSVRNRCRGFCKRLRQYDFMQYWHLLDVVEKSFYNKTHWSIKLSEAVRWYKNASITQKLDRGCRLLCSLEGNALFYWKNQLHLFYESYGGLEVGFFLYPSITRTMTHCFSVIMKDQYSLGIVWEFSIFLKMLHVSWMCQQNWIKVTYQCKYNFLLHSCVRYITQSCVWYITQNVLFFYSLFSSHKRT